MPSVIQYDLVHFITRAKSTSNPKGLKNVANTRKNIDNLVLVFVLTTITFHIMLFYLRNSFDFKNAGILLKVFLFVFSRI